MALEQGAVCGYLSVLNFLGIRIKSSVIFMFKTSQSLKMWYGMLAIFSQIIKKAKCCSVLEIKAIFKTGYDRGAVFINSLI